MSSMSSFRSILLTLTAFISFASAHIVITYPGWRGDNLQTNGTVGIDDYSTGYFPYGMQWMYPCGGLGISRNRTYWPVTGGAVGWQPGWFQGHSTAFQYVNLGLGTTPPNYSHPMVPVFEVVGPRNTAYPGLGVCIPQVGLPANITVKPGDNATIQVVEAAKHGAALYSCVDITFTDDMSLVLPVTPQNCQNSTQLGFNMVISTLSLTGASSSLKAPALWILASIFAGVAAVGSLFIA